MTADAAAPFTGPEPPTTNLQPQPLEQQQSETTINVKLTNHIAPLESRRCDNKWIVPFIQQQSFSRNKFVNIL